MALSLPCGAQERDGPVPAGFGTLKQEDVALQLETAQLLVTVLPLHEEVIRLLAPEAWSALSQLTVMRRDQIAETATRAGIEEPSLFLVSFYARDRGTSYDPDALSILSGNQFFRPLGAVPITPGWGARQLEQRQRAIAIMLFEPGIAVWERMEVSYDAARNTGWERVLRQLEQERAAALARAAAAGRDSLPR
jgi:hypothetical protein